MAQQDRAAADHLIRRLLDTPYIFDFFQALRRLENTRPDLPRIGHSQRLADDPVRFGQEASLAFPPSALSRFKQRDALPPRLFVTFFGLLGANGPLPHHLTEYARERERHFDDPTFSRFLDLFHHRLISLFYRAWASCNKAVQFERAMGDIPGHAAEERVGDEFFHYLGSLLGIGMSPMLGRDSLSDIAKVHYAGRLVPQNRNAEGLRWIVADYFGVPCELDQFVGQWMNLPADCRCMLGKSRENGLLGSTVIVGARMWEAQQKFRLSLGPLTLKEYERLLPGGSALTRLKDWVLLYCGRELSWDLKLILKQDEVPQIRLGSAGRLGWSTWLRSAPHPRDADDLVLIPPE